MPPIEERDVEQKWRSQGFGFRASRCSPGGSWPDAGHAVREIVMVVKGDVEIQIGEDVVRAEIGVEYIVPAAQPHEIRNLGSEPARIFFGYENLAD